jgi:hypothetical protein
MSCTNITWPSSSPSRIFYRHHFYRFALLQGSVQVSAASCNTIGSRALSGRVSEICA